MPFTLTITVGPDAPDPSIVAPELREVYREVGTLAVELRGRGKTYAEIAAELNRRGYRTRRGKAWRDEHMIRKLLKTYGGEANDGLAPDVAERTEGKPE